MTNLLSFAIQLLVAVESGGEPRAYNATEQAAGVLQIRPILVKDVNRLLGRDEFSEADRWDPGRSVAMATIYLKHYGSPTRLGRPAKLADYGLLWCAGPDGPTQKATPALKAYVAKMRAAAENHVSLLRRFIEDEQWETQ